MMKRISNNKLFMYAFNFSAIGMAIVATDGKWLQVNSSLCKSLGYSKKELEQMTFQEITHPDDLTLVLDNLKKLLRGEVEYYQIVKRYIQKSGCILWGLLSVSLVKDEQNRPLYFISQIQDITKQKELQEKLKKSEERYRNWIQYSPEPMAIHSEGRLIYVNEAGVKLAEVNGFKELVGKNLLDYIHPDYKEIVFQRNQQMVTTNQNVEPHDIKLIGANGKEIDIRISSVPIDYEGKKVIQTFFSDITQRKKMEEAIRKNEAQYKSLIEHNPDAVFGVDLEGNFTLVNESCTRITGYSEEEFLKMSFFPLLYGEDLEKAAKSFNKVIQGGTETIVVSFHKKNGDKLIVTITSVPIMIDGTITGLYAVAKDVTEQKRMEEELKASEERFRLFAEYSSDLITMVDVNKKYIYISPACKEILQYDEDELIGKESSLLIHPDDQEMVQEQVRTIFATGEIVITFRIRRKDGEYVWLECACKLLNEIHSGEQKFIAVSRNINERKLAEQKLQEANEILQRLSTIDGLTGVSNRRAFDERLEMEWNRGLRNSSFLSLIMLDLDYFKAFNDTYGHQAGDSCLKQIASVIQETLGRTTDLLCRYGGEEFCVILPDTEEAGAKIVGEEIRNSIRKLEIPHAGSTILPWVTISVGTATMIPTVYTSYMDLVSKADKALYRAKNDGRNCVRSF